MNRNLNWRKRKTLAMLANRKQWQREFSVDESTAAEIQLEQGGYLITETSSESVPNYIITE